MRSFLRFACVYVCLTLRTLCRRQLLSMPGVLFAGYKVPHPLEPYFILKVQTNGIQTPSVAVQEACKQIIETIASVFMPL